MNRRTYNIHERFLQHIWSKQYLRGDLHTADGRPLTVIHPGSLNSDGGPDFCGAKVRIDRTTFAGDVEIHRTAFDWIQHQHQEDPRYNTVVLHVVLEASTELPPTFVQCKRQIPVLVLGNYLVESIHTIWQKAILDERAEHSSAIPCFETNSLLTTETIDSWLKKLRVERIELKLHRFEERLKQLAHEERMTLREHWRRYGGASSESALKEIPPPLPELTARDYSKKRLWEQILYEGIMEGLGYSKNCEPFLRLARNVTLQNIEDLGCSAEILEALLFGAAGLIPKIGSVRKKESRDYVRRLTREWKTMRSRLHIEILHRGDWQFFPTRPSNFPTLRIAAAAAIIDKLLRDDLFRGIVQTMKASLAGAERAERLVQLLSIDTGEFWARHYSFDEATQKTITALGTSRIHDIVINAILPVSLLYARIFKDAAVRDGALEVYDLLPAHDSNSITRLMEEQLLKGRVPLANKSRQQAVIQLYKYYCMEQRCGECELGRRLFS